jgi:hypothetical protein
MNMKKKIYFAAILGMALTAGLFLAGCDNLTTSPNNNKDNSGTEYSGVLNGTWKYGNYEITIDGGSYVMKSGGVNYGKGTITYSIANSTFTFQSTYEWAGSKWSPNNSDRVNGKLTYNGGNTLTISNLDNYQFLAGTWTKQSSSTSNTDSKTIIITGFPGSIYSGKLAALTLHSPATADQVTAIGVAQISGSQLSIPLYTSITDSGLGPSWKGTGSYFILLMVSTSDSSNIEIEKVFIYSSTPIELEDLEDTFPTYPITEKTSTIPFSKFYDVTEWVIDEGLLG